MTDFPVAALEVLSSTNPATRCLVQIFRNCCAPAIRMVMVLVLYSGDGDTDSDDVTDSS